VCVCERVSRRQVNLKKAKKKFKKPKSNLQSLAPFSGLLCRLPPRLHLPPATCPPACLLAHAHSLTHSLTRLTHSLTHSLITRFETNPVNPGTSPPLPIATAPRSLTHSLTRCMKRTRAQLSSTGEPSMHHSFTRSLPHSLTECTAPSPSSSPSVLH
jgi:hypothetical protein